MKIALVGDIMQHDIQHELEKARNYSYGNIISDEVAELLNQCDVRIGNLETPILLQTELHGFPKFAAHSNFVRELSKHFDVLSTANNHTWDHNEKGVFTTVSSLRMYNVKFAGTISKYVVFKNVYFQAMSTISNKPVPAIYKHIFNQQLTEPNFKYPIRIAYIHCGKEYSSKLTSAQKFHIDNAIMLGYNVVCCIHSHVIGDINDIRQGVFVSNGLGNFISMQKNLDRQLGQIVILTYNSNIGTFTKVEKFTAETVIERGQQVIKLASI